jgi:hypothetical protein
MIWKFVAITTGIGIALTVLAGGAAGGEFQYVGAKKCRTCHKKELIGNQYGHWEDSRHAKAFETLASDKALEYAQKKGIQGPPQKADECVKCHVTAYGADPSEIGLKPLNPADGVQCESCHGPGSGYKKKKIMSDREEAVANGLVIPDEEVCLRCHNDESPAWDPAKYVLADGSPAGFDFEQAKKEIEHPIPEDVKGNYIELEKKLKAEKRARGEAAEDEAE